MNLVKDSALDEDPKLILREMLPMAVGHSKSKVPIEDMNHPERFRKVMMRSASVDLHHLYTIRALRVADALRQRGSVLKTSGSYQILVDQNTANAVYALEKGSGERFHQDHI